MTLPQTIYKTTTSCYNSPMKQHINQPINVTELATGEVMIEKGGQVIWLTPRQLARLAFHLDAIQRDQEDPCTTLSSSEQVRLESSPR